MLEYVQLYIDPLLIWLKNFFTGFFNALISGLWNIVWRFFEFIYGIVSGFFYGIIQFFDNVFGETFEFFESIWNFIKAVASFLGFLADCYFWIRDFVIDFYNFCEGFYLWLIGKNDEFGVWLWERIQAVLTWFGDFFTKSWERAQDFIFQNGQWLYEWLIGNIDKCVQYFVNLIHDIFNLLGIQIQMPDGAWQAIMQFLQWGMFFNDFFPIQEMFQLLGIYLIFVVMMSMVRFVRSMIPFFH